MRDFCGVLFVLLAAGIGPGCPSAEADRNSPATAAVASPPPAAAVPAEPPPAPTPSVSTAVDPMTLTADASTSVGAPGDGHLLGGAELPRSAPGLRANPLRPNATAGWGTVEMVQALLRAAAVVDREMPGSSVTINDLSLPGGGPIVHHGSHESGRDVDVLFYMADRHGQPMPAKGVPLDLDGHGTDYQDLSNPRDDVPMHLDASRTWRFLQALAEDPAAHVQRIFIAEHVRTLLLARADRIRARGLVEAWTCQPDTPHDDHMHIRFYCSPDDITAGCADTVPIYPWQREFLAALSVEPRPAPPRRRQRAGRTVSSAAAREAAGPMHPSVRAFLQLRESWSRQPHPGRPWCR